MQVKLYINKETNIPQAVMLHIPGQFKHCTADIRDLCRTLPFGKLECCISRRTMMSDNDESSKSYYQCMEDSVYEGFTYVIEIETEKFEKHQEMITHIVIEDESFKLLKTK